MSKLVLSVVILGFATLLLASTSARADLITNGSFETLNIPFVGTFMSFTSTVNATAIAGWTITAGNIDYGINGNGFWPASNGVRSIDLNGSAAGTIAQTFVSVAGQQYTVTFDMAADTYGAPAVKTLQVRAAGQLQDFSFDDAGKSPANMGWTSKSWSFTAIGSSTTLEFASTVLVDNLNCSNLNLGRGPACFGATLDNVHVSATQASAVPEPASLLLLGSGLALVVRRSRRRALKATRG